MNFSFFHDEKYGLSLEMRDERNFLVAYIEYEIINNKIIINNIERTAYANRNYSDYHFGTTIFNYLIKYIVQDRKTPIVKIVGDLVYADAYNGNWLNSIPFYADFPNHINPELQISLSFHLYIKDKKEEIYLPSTWSNRREYIKEMIKNCLNTYREYYFEFIIS